MSDDNQEEIRKSRRSEAFFGRRKSKALSPKAQQRFDKLFPGLKIDPTQAPVSSASALFDHQPEQIILEIGFGGGEHLLHQAKSNPQNGYIGVEPFVNSMAKALRNIDDDDVGNIRLYDEDAVEILDWLPEASIDRIDLLYPDPWPKIRHWKRRFVSQKNLDRFARVLRPGGKFHFASDIDTYINWTLQHCEMHKDFEWTASSAEDWHAPYHNWIRTRYEAKAIREGRMPCYLRFERN
ncbi:MAG: tRNA (guanosine(46)-N7)-methyltransferase TrmB [Rhizobiaceae bacterium]|nr:tRNA (guanosine(46)-N7)-methyltransferase TrmB [Rhizobiaceae bacterium]